MLFKKIRKRLGLFSLEKEGVKWVEKNLGPQFVDEFKEKYDKITSGIPIGGFLETAVFLDMIETIKKESR